MNYPKDRVEYPEGTYEWSMKDNDTISIYGSSLLINRVIYKGIVSLKRGKAKKFVLSWNDIYFARVGNALVDPTRAAMVMFRDRVVEIVNRVDTDQTRYETRIAMLEEEKNEVAGAIIELKEEIDEFEDRIKEIEPELKRIILMLHRSRQKLPPS